MITTGFLQNHVPSMIPSTVYSIESGDSRNGRYDQIKPTNPLAAQMTVWANQGYCDISFGRAFQIELEHADDEFLLELIDAVLLGRIGEVIWSRKEDSNHSYSKSFIQLANRKASCRWGIPFIYPPWWKRSYSYEPYEPMVSSAPTK
jgi:hypothetical protein